MNLVSQLAELVKNSKGFECHVKCINPDENQFSLALLPVSTITDKGTNESVKQLEHMLNQQVRITGTPEEIDGELTNNFGSLVQARQTANSNLSELIEGLNKKPTKKAPARAASPKKTPTPRKTPMMDDPLPTKTTTPNTAISATDTQKAPVTASTPSNTSSTPQAKESNEKTPTSNTEKPVVASEPKSEPKQVPMMF